MLDRGFPNPYSKHNLKGGVLVRLPGKGRNAKRTKFLFNLEQSLSTRKMRIECMTDRKLVGTYNKEVG